jgi:hypothetical protein
MGIRKIGTRTDCFTGNGTASTLECTQEAACMQRPSSTMTEASGDGLLGTREQFFKEARREIAPTYAALSWATPLRRHKHLCM